MESLEIDHIRHKNNAEAKAIKLLEIIEKLLSEGKVARARAIWELLQNAIDADAKNCEIIIDQGTFKFMSNAEPFTINSLLSIVDYNTTKIDHQQVA